MGGRPDLASVVIDAKGFTNLLERTEFASRVIDSDRRIIGLVRDARWQAVGAAASLRIVVAQRAAVALSVRARRDRLAAVRRTLIDARVRASADTRQQASGADLDADVATPA